MVFRKICRRRASAVAWACVTAAMIASPLLAASPASVQQGRVLFERNWPVGNPQVGGDGLGPLFNAKSCVACHRQAGVGGAGDSRFNAKTVGIETMTVKSNRPAKTVNDAVVAKLLATFHPGFVTKTGTIINTLPIAHFGGSPEFDRIRQEMMKNTSAQYSAQGGPSDPTETRQSLYTPIFFENTVDGYTLSVKARVFHRNTTPLFGAGLIDQVPSKLIANQARAQKRHPEISGRPSILDDGRLGKFGWRGNVGSLIEFNDQACAAEVGLETRRKKQPKDPLVPGYRNPALDIGDDQIRAMNDFVASLPRPVQRIPDDSELRYEVERGRQVFASVGCATCHVPDMGPASGLYSDLLLHDMGPQSYDLNPAEPYRVAVTPVRLVAVTTDSTTQVVSNTTQMGGRGYYGGTSTISTRTGPQTRGGTADPRSLNRDSGGGRLLTPRHFVFQAPTVPPKMRLHDLGTERETFERESSSEEEFDDTITGFGRSMRLFGTRQRTTKTRGTIETQTLVRVHYEPTNFNQEWRTPPLWGVRDSAPYMHDGRAETLLEAVTVHGGEASGTRDRFLSLPLADRHAVIAFMETLVAPPQAIVPAPES